MSNNLPTKTGGASLQEAMTPTTFEQAVRFSEMVSKTQFVPQAFRGKPDDCLAAITYGAELGLSPMQSLRGVAVINGAPAVYGDTLLAVCQAHPQWAGKEEWIDGEGDKRVAHCIVKRKGEPDVHATFSVADAKEASLWGKQGPWKQYSGRMLAMRARSFALRDQFSDALRGVIAAEEAGDYQHYGPDRAKDVSPPKTADERRAAMQAAEQETEPAHGPNTGEVQEPVAVESEPAKPTNGNGNGGVTLWRSEQNPEAHFEKRSDAVWALLQDIDAAPSYPDDPLTYLMLLEQNNADLLEAVRNSQAEKAKAQIRDAFERARDEIDAASTTGDDLDDTDQFALEAEQQ